MCNILFDSFQPREGVEEGPEHLRKYGLVSGIKKLGMSTKGYFFHFFKSFLGTYAISKNDEDRGSHTYVLYHNDKSGFYFKFSIWQKFLRETII